jgi:hypothetical protein
MKKLVDDFNQKLQTFDNEDLLEWNRLEFTPSDPKALATLAAQRVLPQELIDFLEHFSTNKFEQMEILPYIWQLIFLKRISVDMYNKITNKSFIKAL